MKTNISIYLSIYLLRLVLKVLVAPLGEQVVEPVRQVEDGEQQREDESGDDVDPLGAASELRQQRLRPRVDRWMDR